MNIRFYNGKVLTMADGYDILEKELWVQGNKITYIGEKVDSDITWDEEIDLGGNLLMPGFKNAHTHTAMTFLRSNADDYPLHQWLTEHIFPREAQLNGDDVYWLSILGIMEYLTSGITANFDMYFPEDKIVKASVDTGFRTVLCGALNNFVSSIENMEYSYLKYNDEKYKGLISYMLGFHAEYTTSEELLKNIAELAKKYKAPVWTHNSETRSEVEDCIERYGKSPTKLFDELGIYDFGGGGYHCVYLNEEDMEIFKEKNLYVVTNPSSNIKLASGIAPIEKFVEKGIPVGIGTDGPASNNALDMFREMFLVSGLTKVNNMNAAILDGNEVLKMATVNSAHAMGLKNCDVLSEGKLADLIVIDLNRPNMRPINNISKNIVYSGSKENIKLTMVDGKILYRDGKFNIGFDENEIYDKAQEIAERIK
ncbi:amidohydrolase [Lagierella sp.]|uniref:amidohydrolase n=1 Tax=Lagierella sp. TaxID=2849657 RepID=UPI00261AD414|nr:amidohydrolase [Lagierella sp.]